MDVAEDAVSFTKTIDQHQSMFSASARLIKRILLQYYLRDRLIEREVHKSTKSWKDTP